LLHYFWQVCSNARVVGLWRHRLTGNIEEIYELFDRPVDAPPSPYDVQISSETTSMKEHHDDAVAVRTYTPSTEWCAVCCGSHATSKCHHLNGMCFACGHTGHSSSKCPRPLLVCKTIDTIDLFICAPSSSHNFCSAKLCFHMSA
jgi:hypothetical protein